METYSITNPEKNEVSFRGIFREEGDQKQPVRLINFTEMKESQLLFDYGVALLELTKGNVN